MNRRAFFGVASFQYCLRPRALLSGSPRRLRGLRCHLTVGFTTGLPTGPIPERADHNHMAKTKTGWKLPAISFRAPSACGEGVTFIATATDGRTYDPLPAKHASRKFSGQSFPCRYTLNSPEPGPASPLFPLVRVHGFFLCQHQSNTGLHFDDR